LRAGVDPAGNRGALRDPADRTDRRRDEPGRSDRGGHRHPPARLVDVRDDRAQVVHALPRVVRNWRVARRLAGHGERLAGWGLEGVGDELCIRVRLRDGAELTFRLENPKAPILAWLRAGKSLYRDTVKESCFPSEFIYLYIAFIYLVYLSIEYYEIQSFD
jgi:hypothetical protein